jgi:glycerophosphoryl diester phosphodiesterase
LHDLQAGVPENTLPAFEAAIAAGYPIELDVQQLADGSLVVFHDDDLRRAVGVDLRLARVSYETLRAQRLFGTDLRAPALADVLALVAGRVPIMLEVKYRGRSSRIAQAVQQAIASYAGRLAIQSFNPFVMAWFRRHTRGRALGQLAGPLEEDPMSGLERLATRRLLTLALSRPDFINYDLRALPDPWISWLSSRLQLPLVCWTVRNEQDQKRAENHGINYVFEGIRP